MEYRQLGKTDLKVSAICLGTMTFGDQNTEAEAHQQLDYAFGNGINFIDTAEMYPVPPKADTFTKTETIVGRWLKHQSRDKIILGGKVAGPRRRLDWIRGGPSSLDEWNIRSALEDSLKRLQTDYIDVYQLHWPERNVPMFGQYLFDPSQEYISGVLGEGPEREWVSIHQQLETLQTLVQEGKIRYIGLSNEQPWGLMQFLNLAERYQLPRVASLQNCYNLMNRGIEFGMTEVLYREQVSLLAYSPLAFGHLTGKYIDNPKAQGRVNLFPGYAQRYNKPNVGPASQAYRDLAQRYGMTATQQALAFVFHRWCVTSTVIGATSQAQLKENIESWNIQLSHEHLAEIEQLHLRMMNPAP